MGMRTICMECGYVISDTTFTAVYIFCPKCQKFVRTVVG